MPSVCMVKMSCDTGQCIRHAFHKLDEDAHLLGFEQVEQDPQPWNAAGGAGDGVDDQG